MELINYYTILSIPNDASDEAIKRAYRKLALKLHTDKSHDKETECLFNTITEAKNTLLDPILRKNHDKSLRVFPTKAARQRRGTDINLNLKIAVSDIATESIKNIMTTRQNHCPDCFGTGCSKKFLNPCEKCGGTGIDLISAVMGPKKACTLCKGYGDYPEKPDCKRCKGTGIIPENITRQIKINRNFQPTFVIPKSGNLPLGGNTPGDLIVSFIVEKTSNYEIEGKNIKGQLKISPAQAILGDIIFLDVFGNVLKINLPAGAKHGDIIEKENAGVTKGNKKGSLMLKIYIDVQKKITEEEKKLYTQLLKLQKGYL